MSVRDPRTPTGIGTFSNANETLEDFCDRQLVRVMRSIRLVRSEKRDEVDAERQALLAERFTTKKDRNRHYVPDEVQVSRHGALHSDAHAPSLSVLEGDPE